MSSAAMTLGRLSPFSLSLLTHSPSATSLNIPTLADLQRHAKGMSDGLPSLPSYSVQPAIEPSPPKYAERDPSVYTVESTRAATATTGGKEKERKLRKGRKGWGRLDGGVQRGIPGEDDVRPRGKSGLEDRGYKTKPTFWEWITCRAW